ncbi:nuclease-related domain-containing protein [Undibacterium sp. SXout7W]|uniref:nuclease-related domain-containing protein n=1 Tax=Undibacterium sp. SXout7W TaxID=3413049 RepID=UPI003BF3D583
MFTILQSLISRLWQAITGTRRNSASTPTAATTQQKREQAGESAELAMQKDINDLLVQYPGATALHGSLLVFHRGRRNEFSIEVDHILITKKHVYVIETKYQSGDIYPSPHKSEWRVRTRYGEKFMRNAFKQAQNHQNVLSDQFQIDTGMIPLVAIVGKSVTLHDPDMNVFFQPELAEVIAYFEGFGRSQFRPKQLAKRFSYLASDAPDDWERHVHRARRAKSHAQSRMSPVKNLADVN